MARVRGKDPGRFVAPWKWDGRRFHSAKLGMLAETAGKRKQIGKGETEDKGKKKPTHS